MAEIPVPPGPLVIDVRWSAEEKAEARRRWYAKVAAYREAMGKQREEGGAEKEGSRSSAEREE